MNSPCQDDDGDYDIRPEYDVAVEGALGMRRDFLRQTRQLKGELLAKQAEIDRLTTGHQQKLLRYRKAADATRDRLHKQNIKLRRYRDDNKLLRLRNQELPAVLKPFTTIGEARLPTVDGWPAPRMS